MELPRNWALRATDESLAQALALELGIRPATARVLTSRGVKNSAAADAFLTPRLKALRSPIAKGSEIASFAAACDLLIAEMVAGRPVGIFGDYDVDGCTSAAILFSVFRSSGATAFVRVAERSSGYGFGIADADALIDQGARLIVTCDLGTSDVPTIEHAKGRGCAVIVLDHHHVPDGDPAAHPAAALINPHRSDDLFPFKGLASCGLAFYLACAIRTRLGESAPERSNWDPKELLDLVAVGTLCDLAPLEAENRILVSHGLATLARRQRPGFRALLDLAGVERGQPITETDVGFRIGPRLNAPGRLGSAAPSLELLLAQTDSDAIRLAGQLETANRTRQTIQEQVFGAALAQAEELGGAASGAIVVAGEGWSAGVVGIVAAKLVEQFGCPAVVLALEPNADGSSLVGRGSLRTSRGVHLYRALSACAPLLMRFGGHAQAAGVTLDAANLAQFRREFSAACVSLAERGAASTTTQDLGQGPGPSQGQGEQGRANVVGALLFDASVVPSEIDSTLADELDRLGPFGVGNQEPSLLVTGLRIEQARVVGERHLKLALRSTTAAARERTLLDAIAFRAAARKESAAGDVAILCRPEWNFFRGKRTVQLRLHDFAQVPSDVAAATDSSERSSREVQSARHDSPRIQATTELEAGQRGK